MPVSVIVPTVGGPYLGEQLKSLAEQTVPPDEVIVVNNGVPGTVTREVEHWRSLIQGLRLVEDRSVRGPGHARNVGAAHARHPALVFLDDDDVADSGYVEAMSKALDEAPMVGARIDVDTLNPPELAKRWRGMQDQGTMTFHDFLPWVGAATLGMRRAAFEKVGGFDPAFFAEDTDICWRAQLAGLPPPAFEPRAVVSIRLRTTPRAAFRQARSWGRAEVSLYRRYQDHGHPRPPSQLRALARWARPLVVLVRGRDRMAAVEAARLLGERIGRLQGSLRERCMFL